LHLFQGRYKAFLVPHERYLFALLRYIHFNPVRAGIVDRPERCRWSSDRFYRSGEGPFWLDLDVLLGRLAPDRAAAVAVYRRLMARREEQTYENVTTFGLPLKGDREFVEHSLVAIGESRQLPSRWTPESLADCVAIAEGLPFEELRQPGKSKKESRARLMAAYLGRRYAGFSIASTAKCFGREESTFNRGVPRLEELMKRDGSVRDRVEQIASSLELRNTGIHD
jgi:putative transposase